MITKKQNLFSNGFCVLFLLNLLIPVYGLFSFSPNARCESYPECSRYFRISKEELDSSKDSHHNGSENLSAWKLAAEIAGGCTLNLSSFIICLYTLSAEGDDPEIPGFVMSIALAPLVSSLAVTGVGYLVRDEGSWAGALIGACVPVLVGIFVASSVQYSSEDALIPVFIGSQCSPIGAVVGYNLGRPLAKYKWLNYVLAFSAIVCLWNIFVALP